MDISYGELRKIEAIVFRIMGLIERLGLGKDINTIINNIQRIVMMIRMLQVTIHAFEVASGPIGWVYAGVTAVGTAVMAVTTLQEMGSEW
jgi:hypothetical protein